MKIQNILEATFDPGNMGYIKRDVPIKNSATAKLPNAFVNKHLEPVVYRNGNSVDDQIGLDFEGHEYTDDTSAKDGTPKKKKERERGMKIPSFKEYVNSLKASPYNYLVSNTEEFKKEEADNGIEQTKEEKDAENNKSLLQYLLYASAANQK